MIHSGDVIHRAIGNSYAIHHLYSVIFHYFDIPCQIGCYTYFNYQITATLPYLQMQLREGSGFFIPMLWGIYSAFKKPIFHYLP